jgi:hypothetical protein
MMSCSRADTSNGSTTTADGDGEVAKSAVPAAPVSAALRSRAAWKDNAIASDLIMHRHVDADMLDDKLIAILKHTPHVIH